MLSGGLGQIWSWQAVIPLALYHGVNLSQQNPDRGMGNQSRNIQPSGFCMLFCCEHLYPAYRQIQNFLRFTQLGHHPPYPQPVKEQQWVDDVILLSENVLEKAA